MVRIFVILIVLNFFNIHCDGKNIEVELKIKDDWEDKREFIYLKSVELNNRFVLKTIKRSNNQHACFYKNIERFLNLVNFNSQKNIFKVEIKDCSRYIPTIQLNKQVVIEIANNEIIQKILPGIEKRLLLNNNFIEKKKNNYYETSILEESLGNINKKELLKENIENYKGKLLSIYWTEINLIGYKIELLEKQKVEYQKELESRIIYIGNKISN
uniref:Uncharacterized protein n=1 Tax=Meloidogyne enterolobii TaxID=390850 RepID=A0A6V7XBQ9_MELEN|nr:unnamed protein product [Meloidogyne enterolobii]